MFRLIFQLLQVKFGSFSNKNNEYKRILFHFLENKGGLYIKFLQLLSVNPEFTTGWAGPKEMKVFEQVELEPLDLDSYLDPTSFSSLETHPFAAGSFAQVYKGQLSNGQAVAIKILRPSVAQNLHHDIRYIKFILKIASFFLSNSILDLNVVATEFCRNALLETDYLREMVNQEFFAKHYQESDQIIIPRVYQQLSSSRVIVQDFIPGPTLAEVLAARTAAKSAVQLTKDLTGSNLWTQLTVVGSACLSDAFIADYGIGDPHPGNIKLLSNNKIGFIDFGMIANPPTNRQAFYEYTTEFLRIGQGYKKIDKILYTCLNFFCPELVVALQNCQIIDPQTNQPHSIMDHLLQAFEDKLSTVKGEDRVQEFFNKGRMFKMINEVLDQNNILDIKISDHDFMFLKSCNIFLNSLHTVDQESERSHYAQCFFDCLTNALQAADRYGLKENRTNHSPNLNTSESYEVLADLLSSVANKDQFIFERFAYRI